MADPLRQSLRRTALRCLAQREHSRSELQGRLLRRATRPARALPAGEAAPQADPEADATALPALRALVEAVLDQLEAQGLLSDQRFLETRVHARRAQWGSRRIAHELKQHGLTLTSSQSDSLADSELSRALALWRRRFEARTDDPKAQLRQMRFLAARGFSGSVVRQVVQGRHNADDDDALSFSDA